MAWHAATTATIISSWTAQLATLQIKENEHLSALTAIHSEMADLKRKITTATNAKAPISSLPVETLAAIFEVTAFYSPLTLQRSKIPAEIMISHVSSHWRHVALSRPSLWTNIEVTFPNLSPWCQTYITRSQQSLVSLVINIDYYGPEVSPNFKLNPQSQFIPMDGMIPRIHRLALIGCRNGDLVPVYDYWRQVSPPVLEYLYMQITDWDDFDGDWPYSLFDRAPALHTLRFESFDISKCSVPASTVTHLSIISEWSMLLSEFRDALQRFIFLTHLDLSGRDPVEDWSVASDVGRLHLLALTHLRIDHSWSNNIGENLIAGFLSNLHAPELTYLDLRTDDAHIAPFLHNTRSPNYHSVRTLVVSSNSLQRIHVTPLLSRKFPAITSLDLLSGATTGDALRNMVYEGADESAPIWDHLDTLTVRAECLRAGDDGLYSNIRALQEIVSTRRRAGCPIYKVRVLGDITSELTANPDILDTFRTHQCEVEQVMNNQYENPFKWPQIY